MGSVAASQSVTGTEPVVAPTGSFDAAHRAMSADKSLQFDMKAIEPVAPPAPPPGWLRGLFEFLSALGPVFKIIFWLGLAAIVLAIAWYVLRELIRIRLPGKGIKPAVPAAEWRPAPAAALSLLSDADALAAEGRFAEAVHLLLLRSINDIDGRLPNTVRPALTARDIADLSRLPAAARPAFKRIARVVEASLFGGQPVDRETFSDCREADGAFAFPQAWAA
jgi:hypothetical protein